MDTTIRIPQAVEQGDSSECVLVVDDQRSVTRTVSRWLERDGIECEVAHSAREALQRMDARAFGIVFADVNMPGITGLELTREIKGRDPAIQVVIITGNTALETAVEALRLGADDYLVKPFKAPSLLHAARRAAEHRRLLVENRDYRHTLEQRVQEQARRIEKLYLSSVHSLVTALEAKDPHTRGHSDRVADYALALAAGMDGIDEEALRIGAQLHDIGKIGIGSRILRKCGSLDADEVEEVHSHPGIGVDILAPLLGPGQALDVVRYHHERWDGTGYPDGLAGEEIPLVARIVSVADTFDAMTTTRPYRGALSAERALAEIEAEAGRQFDPAIAARALEALRPSMVLVS